MKNNQQLTWPYYVMLAVSSVILCFAISSNFDVRTMQRREMPVPQDKSPEADTIASSVLMYMSQPSFANSDFLFQVYGVKAKMVMHNLDQKMAYFSLPGSEDWQAAVSKLSLRPDRVEFAKLDGSKIVLGGYTYNGDGRFFRIQESDLRGDPNAKAQVKLGSVTYWISMQELSGYADDKVTVGGRQKFILEQSKKKMITAANFGACVALPGEPSLGRLVAAILNGETNPSIVAQKLLNFVTTDIEYAEEEKGRGVQTIRRPAETLLTGRATCGSKVALYASLLEQVGIDYWIAYYPSKAHVVVFVAGRYPDLNGYTITSADGKTKFYLAETTSSDFMIGIDRFEDKREYLKNPEFLQKPRDHVVFRMKDGEKQSL